MPVWEVEFHEDFHAEMLQWPQDAQDELLAKARLLEEFGPTLRRPHVDTLKGSKHSNMKELRFGAAGGVWRVAFAFAPSRKSIFLAGGSKSGTSEKRFYTALIARADKRFAEHLARESSKRK